MAASPTLERRYTPEDLLTLEDGSRYELIDGQLVEPNVSETSSSVAFSIGTFVNVHVLRMRLGRMYGADLLVRAFPWASSMVRKPDSAFIQASRVPPADVGIINFAPDWVLESVSPNDLAYEVRAKVDLWLRAGVRLVWVAYPATMEIHVYRAGTRPQIFTAEDEITGEDVIPGFSANVGGLFPAPVEPAAQD